MSKSVIPTDIDKALRKHNEANKRMMLAVSLLQREPVLRLILVECALARKLTVEDVLPASRERHIVWAMHEFCYRAMTETLASSVLIGHLTARDHSSVLYGAAHWAHIKGLPMPRGTDGKKYFQNNRQHPKAQKGEMQHGA